MARRAHLRARPRTTQLAEPITQRDVVCYHCGDTVRASSEYDDAHPFCCVGCLTAYRIIRDSGRTEYYRYRTRFAPRPRTPSNTLYDLFEQGRERHQSGTVTAVFLVEGIHCASCVWINELVLRDIPGVLTAEVRLSTGRAYITWDPQKAPLAQIAAATARLGYRLVPLNRTGEPQSELRSRSLLRRMVVAGFFAGNMMLLSVALYAGYFDYMDRETKNALHLLSFLFSLPVLLYSGLPVFRGGIAAIRLRTPTMDLLTSLGISLAFAYSIRAMLVERGEVFFDSITFVVFVLLIGRFVEERLKARMLFFVEGIAPARTTLAQKQHGSDWKEVEASEIHPGDTLRISAGDFLPVDGRLLSEHAETDNAILTGEFRPQSKNRGETIASGARVVGKEIEIIALSDAETGVLGHILALADSSTKDEPRFVQLAERASRWFIGFVLLAGAGTFAFWWGRGVELAVLHTATLLIAACPCALNLSVPTVYTTALQRAYASGSLLGGGALLETLAHVDTIAIDKTGTLTEGNLRLVEIVPVAEHSPAWVMGIARALQAAAALRHPVAEAFLVDGGALFSGPAVSMTTPTALSYEPGRGLRGTIDTSVFLLGSEAFLREEGFLEGPQPLAATTSRKGPSRDMASVTILLGQQSPGGRTEVIATFRLEDRLRPEAVDVVRRLKSRVRFVLLSGDSAENAQEIAEALGLDQVHAPLRPEEKAALIRSMQREGHTVAMLGDGINDSPALRVADCGISFAGAADASVVRSDVVMIDANLGRLVDLFSLARDAQRKVRQNLAISFLYNSSLLPLAFFGYVAPAVAAILMALSSVTVLINSLTLRRRV